LIAQVEEEARSRGLRGVHLGVGLDNAGAQRLYDRLGYQRIGEPYDARWTWHGPNGEQREVVERCYRMYKPLGIAVEQAASRRSATA
jgi:ribosomal protein S18 acetylase RimI-like enzyme